MDENQKFGAGGAQAEQHGREQYGSGAAYERKPQASREMTLEELIRQLLPGHRARCEYQTLRLWQQENEQRKILLETAQKELSTQIEENRKLEAEVQYLKRQQADQETRIANLHGEKNILTASLDYYSQRVVELRGELSATQADFTTYRETVKARLNQAVPPPGSNGPQRPFFGPTIPPPGESAKPLTGGGLAPGDIGLGQPTTLADLPPFPRVFGRSVPQPTTIIPGQPGQKLRITDVERLGAAASAEHAAELNEIEDFRQITRELNMELNPGADSCPLPHTRALKISLTELWHRYYAARDEVKRIREALRGL